LAVRLTAESAQRAIRIYRGTRADRVVAEVNPGGEIVEATIRMVDSRCHRQRYRREDRSVLWPR
jgi:phage terminase large subunit-like protein